jgi:hypothetical protein
VATSAASDTSAAPALKLPEVSAFKMRDYLLLGTASDIEAFIRDNEHLLKSKD